MNKTELAAKFTGIAAEVLDRYDQLQEGALPYHIDRDRWKRRYHGIPKDKLPPFTIEVNSFRPFVDSFVSLLMAAVDEVDIGATPTPPSFPDPEPKGSLETVAPGGRGQ